ncbi:probable protein phosphatase 2C 80 [Syzygium oleosum]|uniref:probable protein phosphatase 2C 80 n=1 Tax=Syzygium oleosum TaxID=219896 RepID=UPI0011D22DBB|nr:probable protein phosphatase 2C 80 [Syzygium oleosum]XP_030462647.1 probable protein phosphatase 2C 80 [Syzygium oleosum]
MPSTALSRLNTTAFCGFRRALAGRQLQNSANLLLQCPRSTVLSTEVVHSPSRVQRRISMAASGSKAVSGDVYMDGLLSSGGNTVDFTKPSSVFFFDRSHRSFRRASVSLTRREPSNGHLVCGYSRYQEAWTTCISTPSVGPQYRDFRTSLVACYNDGAAEDISFEGNPSSDLATSTTSVGQTLPGDRALKLLSGSCCLPHPDKEHKGGEDAHFICEDEQVIGVADGVGGWADVGVDAGLYSRELMFNSVNAIKEETEGSVDPAIILEKAHANTKAKGSSTACIIALKEEGLHAINLGDSGFIVVRDGRTIFRSPVQQHGFNFTYQLENGSNGDLPSSGQVFRIPVSDGDGIVAGTDGLFDNLYDEEVSALVVEAVKSGLDPPATARKIAAAAHQRALDRYRQTPFADSAQEAGFRYHGGKLDDITVVVSYVTRSGIL